MHTARKPVQAAGYHRPLIAELASIAVAILYLLLLAWSVASLETSVDLLARIAAKKKATPAQIALAWLLAQKPWIVPIPGTTKLNRLEENLGAAAVALTADDLRDINEAASRIAVQGDRYPEKLEKMTGR